MSKITTTVLVDTLMSVQLLATTYFRYVAERYPNIHKEANGTPDIEGLIADKVQCCLVSVIKLQNEEE